MAAMARFTVYLGRRELRRSLQAAVAAHSSQPSAPSESPGRRSAPRLLTQLLREPESSVKMMLDLYEESGGGAPACGAVDYTDFWERILVSIRPSSPRKANMVLEWKLEKLIANDTRDHGSFSSLISHCGKLENLPLAEKVFMAMESQGIRPNAAVFNSLIRATLQCGNMVNALSLYEIMRMRDDCDPDLATYNAFIAMHSRRGNSDGMLGWYCAMKAAGFSPDLGTYESLITGFIKAGRFDDADQLFDEMASSGIIPNGIILDCILAGLCRRKKFEEAKELWKLLIAGRWEVEEGMVEKIVALYAELEKVEELEELVDVLEQRPNSAILLLPVYRALVRLSARADRLDDVEYSVGRMLKNGLKLDGWGGMEAIISCYFRCEAYDRLDIFLERIGSSSQKLPKAAYDLLVAGYRRVGLGEKLKLVKEEMESHGLG